MQKAMCLENATNRRKQETRSSQAPRPAVKDTALGHPECSHSPTRGAKAPRSPGEGVLGLLWGRGQKGSQQTASHAGRLMATAKHRSTDRPPGDCSKHAKV